MNERKKDYEFLELVLRYQENDLDKAELEALNEMLRNHPDRMAEFTRVCGTSRLIREAVSRSAQPSRGTIFSIIPRWFKPVGIAAALAVLLTFGYLLFWNQGGDSDLGQPSLAKLEMVGPGTVFSAGHQLPREAGSELGKGWIHLESGKVQILFASGARVDLEGPALFGIDSPLRSYLQFGKVNVYAPESARDFVVATESMEVVDLGTRFELSVDSESQTADVSVSEGLVDLHLGARGTARQVQPLGAGYRAQVDAAGDIVSMEHEVVEPTNHSELVAHWRLDGDATDASPSGFAGEFINSGDGGVTSAVAGQALNFGERGFVDLSDHAEQLGELETFTISAWVRDPSERISIVFSLSDGTESERVQLYLLPRHVIFGWQNGAHYDAVSGRIKNWESDRWYHVAVTVHGGMIALYRDGLAINSSTVGQKIGTPISTFSSVTNPSKAFLGMVPDVVPGARAGSQEFGGAMDDVQIYRGALSQSEISYLYENPGRVWISSKSSD